MQPLAETIGAGVRRAAEHQRQQLLHEASKRLAANLAAWRPPPQFTPCQRAILALHFAFTSARTGLGSVQRDAYEAELRQAAEGEVLDAVCSLIRRDVLAIAHFEVFRYTETVLQAVQRYRGTAH